MDQDLGIQHKSMNVWCVNVMINKDCSLEVSDMLNNSTKLFYTFLILMFKSLSVNTKIEL